MAAKAGADVVVFDDDGVDADPQVREALQRRQTTLPYGPKILNLCFDPSCNLACPSCRGNLTVATGADRQRAEALADRLVEQVARHIETLIVAGFGDPFGSPTYFRLLQGIDRDRGPRLRQVKQALQEIENKLDRRDFFTRARAIKKQPKNNDMVNRIEMVYISRAKKASIHNEYEKTIELGNAAIDEWMKLEDSPFRQMEVFEALELILPAYRHLGNADGEESTLRRMRTLCPDHPYMSESRYYEELGRLFMRNKQYSDAEKALRALLTPTLTPRNAGLMYAWRSNALAEAVDKQGRSAEAEEIAHESVVRAEKLKQPKAVRAGKTTLKNLLERHGKKAQAAELEKQLADDHCPVCHSNSGILRIVYGYTGGRLAPGTYPGGCVVGADSPRFYCPRDKIKF